MIVKMRKVYLVSRSRDRESLLETIRDFGVVHLVPVEESRAASGEEAQAAIKQVERALQVISSITFSGRTTKLSGAEAVQAVLKIQQRSQEKHNRLNTLHRQLEHVLPIWGEVRLEQFDRLSEAGVDVKFYSIPRDRISEIQAELVEEVGSVDDRTLVAVIDRTREPVVPDEAQRVPLPQCDAHDIRAEAAEIDAILKHDSVRLAELAALAPAMEQELQELRQQAEYNAALRGGLHTEPLYAIQGWVPEQKAPDLAGGIARAGIDAAVEIMEPAPDDAPPTLIEPPRWANPIKGLFNVLGTVSGYREFDVSPIFMITLPLFAAMLISDGGYGLVILLAVIAWHKKFVEATGKEFTRLMMIVGIATVAWGIITATFFGVILFAPLIPVDTTSRSQFMLMELSFTIGAIHLAIAHIWQGIRVFPDWRFLNQLGWTLFILGMYGVVRMFVLDAPFGWETPWPYLLIVGGFLAIMFYQPSRNIFKTAGLGILNFPLSMLSSFSDILSYVRLMAVGLASTVLAASFNEMALEMGVWALAIPMMVMGHGLNIALALIAMFAHGVRLNMLEFSSNLGMQWTGYLYKPFSKTIEIQER